MHFTSRPHATWKPPALRVSVLTITILTCWSLIAILQWLLLHSQRNNGIFFSPKISNLPAKQTFLYLYFPTLVAALFSIYWAWIDLEIKRMEPYHQLSKEDGALGKDSLLLEYPYKFVPLVPIKAFRNRHWHVFWASFALILVAFGIVPTQAGIFSVKTITQARNTSFDVSTFSIPVADQATNLTFRYAHSTYGIVALNETLPPFMARNYTLRPFKTSAPVDKDGVLTHGTYTAPTTMYYSDLDCENVSKKGDDAATISYTSSRGCVIEPGLTGNQTVNEYPNQQQGEHTVKKYTGVYAGYHNGFDGYAAPFHCNTTANRTFYAAFQQNKVSKQDKPNNVAAVFCESRYWQQEVVATVDMLTSQPLAVQLTGERQSLALDMFNVTMFETLLNAGSLEREVRADVLPAKATPKYNGAIVDTDLSLLYKTGTVVHPMVCLAALAGRQPLEAYLDWENLAKSYADAYKLTFARAILEVLGNKVTTSKQVSGQQRLITEAVVLEPIFVYVVEGLLAVVSISAIVLLYLSSKSRWNLARDPGTIASIMSLVADSPRLLSEFESLNCCTLDEMKDIVGNRRYKLIQDKGGTGIFAIDLAIADLDTRSSSPLMARRHTTPGIAKAVRPFGLRLGVGLALISLFLALAVLLAVLFANARAQGLPLPSKNSIVQNIIENYIPTVIATLIEPTWILINRLLCMLQPIEELQSCDASAKKSINIGYNSLPPQLVVFKALSAQHFVLAGVCVMALLANLLTVIFSGMFRQETIHIRHAATFGPILDMKFVPLDGTVGPMFSGNDGRSGAFRGGNGEDHFLIAESNISRNTPLPPWTDDSYFYLPFISQDIAANHFGSTEANTQVFGAKLDCRAVLTDEKGTFQANLHPYGDSLNSMDVSINMTVTEGDKTFRCGEPAGVKLGRGPIGNGCSGGPSAGELVLIMRALPTSDNTLSQEAIAACVSTIMLGWLRTNQDCGEVRLQPLTPQNSTLLHCRPKWVIGTAKIRVDQDGRLLEKPQQINVRDFSAVDDADLFSNDERNLAGHSNSFIFDGLSPAYHADSFANDYLNYFIRRVSNSTSMVDPQQPVPTFEEIIGPLNKAYAGLFAIWLGSNKDKLLVAHDNTQQVKIDGSIIELEPRLLLSMPMFIISEVVLCTFILVALLVYARPPGQYLHQLPTSIASTIDLFAASNAVQDMRGTSSLNGKGRAEHLETLGVQYGYGSFIRASDGRVHVGIEKTPFVRRRATTRQIT
ncbi:hypothetical protein BKA63DRAFT_552243 [Paraphoma chrysanthemicola]|nr:hypothetical protein BKA63DRAFT_552243 [Paraphoma chrysanthemicola]